MMNEKHDMMLPEGKTGTGRKPLFILMLGILLTVAATIYTVYTTEVQLKTEFSLVCSEIKTKIFTRLQAHAQLLRNGAAFFAASDSITRQGWQVFNEHARVEENLPGILGVGFSLIIPRNQLKHHVEAIRNEGFPAYSVRPPGDRDFYTSIIYLEPFSGRNLRAFGYDMYSEPVRRKAMEQARDLDVASLSGKVILVQETNKDLQTGTLMYIPVYSHGKPANTVAERRAAITGWIYSPYRMHDLMTGILGRWDSIDHFRIRLQVYDNRIISAKSLLFDSQRTGALIGSNLHVRTHILPIVFNEKVWTLSFTQSAPPLFFLTGKVLIVAIGGFIISFLLFSLSLSLTRLTRRIKISAKLTAELTESEALHQSILKASPDDITITDLEGRILLVSPAALQITGYNSADMLIGHPVTDFLVPEDRERAYTNIMLMFEGKMSGLGEYRGLRFDGSTYEMEANAEFIRDASGQPSKLIFVIRDITERKRTEEKLRNSEEMLRDAGHMGKLGGWKLDLRTNSLQWTEETFRIHEVDPDLQPQLDDGINFYAPEIRPVLKTAIENAISHGTAFDLELPFITAKGRHLWVNSKGRAEMAEGRVISIHGTFQDITDRKLLQNALYETNAYLENLINYANAPIIVWDQQFRITRFNHAFEYLVGRTEAEVLGEQLSILFPPEYATKSMELIHKTLTGERWETVEIKILHRDQSVRTVLWNSATLFEPDGKTPIATIAQGQDITRRKIAENELQLLNASLEARVKERTKQLETTNNELAFKNRELEQFTFIAAHDLQEPLVTLTNFSRLIQEEYAGKLDDDGNKSIEFITGSALRMRELVNGLLNYSILGKESVRTVVDCNKIMEAVLADIDDSIKEGNAVVTIMELPAITGYETELRILFQNLILNAIKFRKKDVCPVITVSAERKKKEFVFSIEDNGIGIEDGNREKIFIIFKRMHNRKEYEGTGIGLAHCKKIAELHGGRIWVEPTRDGGSVFKFSIPDAML